MKKKDVTKENLVDVRTDSVVLQGNLQIPEGAEAVVAFAHGSGSSRHSSRNQAVAQELVDSGLGVLLIDLLTSQEEKIDTETRRLRFDIDLLAGRVVGIVDWLLNNKETESLHIGLFGASTGAAAALMAAAERPDSVGAVVSRGGRVDLAGPALDRVHSPTLLLVGENDQVVLDLNEDAMKQLHCEKKLQVVEGASHLFEEPGKLEKVATFAKEWFLLCLTSTDKAKLKEITR